MGGLQKERTDHTISFGEVLHKFVLLTIRKSTVLQLLNWGVTEYLQNVCQILHHHHHPHPCPLPFPHPLPHAPWVGSWAAPPCSGRLSASQSPQHISNLGKWCGIARVCHQLTIGCGVVWGIGGMGWGGVQWVAVPSAEGPSFWTP